MKRSTEEQCDRCVVCRWASIIMDALALRAPVALVRLFALIAICHATVQLDHGVVPIARKEHVPTSVTPSNASGVLHDHVPFTLPS